jgi:hypothetical protein
MKNLLSFLVFLLTLILGAVAYAYATLEFGDAMHNLSAAAHTLPNRLQSLGLSGQYAVWTNSLIDGDRLILLGFIVIARLFLTTAAAFIGFVLGVHTEDHASRRQPAPARSRSKASTFDRWG